MKLNTETYRHEFCKVTNLVTGNERVYMVIDGAMVRSTQHSLNHARLVADRVESMHSYSTKTHRRQYATYVNVVRTVSH